MTFEKEFANWKEEEIKKINSDIVYYKNKLSELEMKKQIFGVDV